MYAIKKIRDYGTDAGLKKKKKKRETAFVVGNCLSVVPT
jgi:hypothetical protein